MTNLLKLVFSLCIRYSLPHVTLCKSFCSYHSSWTIASSFAKEMELLTRDSSATNFIQAFSPLSFCSMLLRVFEALEHFEECDLDTDLSMGAVVE
ncbi:hypothetical protein EDC04DRAFT_1438445 [Pisolithus marmoratus]|nr:hypothetical protein EDC04DRAFT_1438445 [Pisolithus marmoratus]